MASAAAVGANAGRSPITNDIGEDEGRPGEITSGIYSKSEGLPDVHGNVDEKEDNDDDDELLSSPLRGQRYARPTNGATGDQSEEEAEEEEGDGMGLFGDEDEGEGADEHTQLRRKLDDEELDSGDELERRDRLGDEPEQEYVTQEKITMDLEVARQPIPEPSDGEMYLLKVPSFMSIDPQAWDHTTFQPPTTDHHSSNPPSSTFSAYNVALNTIRWRHSPSHPSELQSNARINRWSDGSITLQMASDPTTQYEIDGNALAPPQRNPIKPTPVSVQAGQKGGRYGAGLGERYNQAKDAFTYLIRPHQESGTLIVTHKITAGLSVKQSVSVEDDAIERLQASLAAANAAKVNGASGISLIQVEEDPELAKARALQAQKERDRAEKRRQAAQDRDAQRTGRELGKRGLQSGRFSGLNVGMLEDDELDHEVGGRGRPSPKTSRAKPRRRRNSEYSEDEDLGRRRFTREDEYDEEDDFVAPSDEEEVVEDDEDEDDGIVEEQVRETTPKRAREGADDEEADAPGEDDDEEAVQQARVKRRRVVDEDDDE